MLEENEKNLEAEFQNLFKSSASGTGEEELLRIASEFSLQLSAQQMRCLLFLEHRAFELKNHIQKKQITTFVNRWLELKRQNNSAAFVMKALEHISLRKYLGENAMKIDVKKT